MITALNLTQTEWLMVGGAGEFGSNEAIVWPYYEGHLRDPLALFSCLLQA
jgi:hypothetical protein